MRNLEYLVVETRFGDQMENIYNKGDGLIVDICPMYGYFEVFGLSEDEFDELADYYNSLV